jgi:hypothetical protein
VHCVPSTDPFCRDCLAEWLRIGSLTCPLCKSKVTAVVHNVLSESVFDVIPVEDLLAQGIPVVVTRSYSFPFRIVRNDTDICA